jgi:3-deoxy-7-phosphoheptulonate synthase
MLYETIKEKEELKTDTLHLKWQDKLIIAGPCTFASYEELYEIAKELKEQGITFLRAGTFKMRTSPYSFQGLREEGMEILLKIKKELGIHIVTEFTTIEQIEKYGNLVDMIQIGTRNMYNYELLKAAGKTTTPVLLKRAMSASYQEWLLAAEYILKEGNENVILCERGIRNFISEETRNILDIQAIPYIKNNTHLRIIIDPSHASGHAYMVPSICKASLAAGADGLLIEVHTHPEQSLCDGKQTISVQELNQILEFKEFLKNK